MINSRHPKGLITLHAFHSNERVLKRIIKRMTKMKRPRNIRRGDND